MSVSLHNKFAAASHPVQGQFLPTAKNWRKFLTLQAGTLILVLSSKEGQNLYPKKLNINE